MEYYNVLIVGYQGRSIIESGFESIILLSQAEQANFKAE